MFCRRPLPVPLVRPVGERGALIAVCDDAGTVLAYGSYLGSWEISGGGFVNADTCVIDQVQKGAGVGVFAFYLASGGLLGACWVDDPIPVGPPGTAQFLPGDLRIGVQHRVAAGSWEERALRTIGQQHPALRVANR